MKRIVSFVLECGCTVTAPRYLRSGRGAVRCAVRCTTHEPRKPYARRAKQTERVPRDCLCCGAPHVEGQDYPDWCDNCQACDPNGEVPDEHGELIGPTFDHRCPRDCADGQREEFIDDA